MPIVDTVIQADILQLLKDINTGDPTEKTADDTLNAFASGLATVIANAIRSGTVVVTSVSGVTPGAGVSGPGTGTIS